MTGRGIDQILAHPGKPRIYESYMKSALGYVEIAEQAHGPIPRPVEWSYIWGEALAEIEARSPDLRIINLETSVTTSDDAAPKGINYRMHPGNVPCLIAAGIDCCVLANNHVLDWGVPGLVETLETLREAGIETVGAGANVTEAGQANTLDLPGKCRVAVHALGSRTSGIPHAWAASETRPGVNLLPDFSRRTANRIVQEIGNSRRPGDLVLLSIHWGGNWGYAIPAEQREFAHALVDEGVVDVIHGHSSHHCKGIEVRNGRLILYGCGDFINDYEGITGHEQYRGDLVLAYFVTFDRASGKLLSVEMVPFRSRRFRLEPAERDDVRWLQEALDREGRALGTRVELTKDGALELRWS